MIADTTLVGDSYPGFVYAGAPRNVYWEMTIACDLACRHCRADAIHTRDPLELDTAEARALLDDVHSMGSMLILTGGDPMKRPDLFELIAYGRSIGLPVSITPSTTPTVTRDAIARFKELGVAALGVSLDGPTAEIHDAFRGVPGTFDHALTVLGWAREVGLPVQVNTTVTRHNLNALRRIAETAGEYEAKLWSVFFLVVTGRASNSDDLTAEEYEEVFEFLYETSKTAQVGS